MRLLLTNDDGIDSPFLHIAVQQFQKAGHEVYIAAPRSEQSWIGAAKSRARAVEVKAVDKGFARPTWVIDGTPSDCVNIALDHLIPCATDIEGVVSGINVGMNASLGFILASGTIAGAFEGALHGLPSLALSHDLDTETYERLKTNGCRPDQRLNLSLECAAQRAASYAGDWLPATGRNRFIVHNLNFPFTTSASTPLRRTIPAQVITPRLFSPADDEGAHRMVFRYGEDLSPAEPLTDRAALSAGWISHSVLDYRQLGKQM